MYGTADEVERLRREIESTQTTIERKFASLSAYGKKRTELLKEAVVIHQRIADWNKSLKMMKTEAKVVLLSEYQSVTSLRDIDQATHEQLVREVAVVDTKAKDAHKNLIPALQNQLKALKTNLARAEQQLARENNNVIQFRR